MNIDFNRFTENAARAFQDAAAAIRLRTESRDFLGETPALRRLDAISVEELESGQS